MTVLLRFDWALKLLFALTISASNSCFAEVTTPTPEPVHENSAQSNIAQLRAQSERMVRSYKPIYFAYGNPLTKIQFSFMSQLSNAAPFYFAYTQVIFWKLLEESKPFGDAMYNPEFFYRWHPQGEQWSAIDIGLWEHQSNGQGVEASRSYDQAYIRANYIEEMGNWVLLISPKLAYIYNLDRTNQDIRKYLSPLDLDFRFVYLMDERFEQSEFIVSLRPGGKHAEHWQQGGYQIAANFRIVGWGINPAFYIQYYHGYAETLLNYNEKVDQFRVGLMF